MLTGCGVDLLRVEQERAGERQQLLAEGARRGRFRRSIVSADTSQNEQMVKVPLLAGEPGVGSPDPVPQDQVVLGQLVGDGQDGGAHALVGGRHESHEQQEQQRGVQVVGLAMLAEHAPLGYAFSSTSALISSAAACHRLARS